MENESQDTNGYTSTGRHKFPKGNKYGKGNPLGRVTKLFRVQLVRGLKTEEAVPKLVNRLMEMALDGTRPVKVRKKIKGSLKFKRVIRHLPVNERVQLVAIQELLSRAVGKSTEFKVIDDNREGQEKKQAPVDFALQAQFLKRVNSPLEDWPPPVREWQKNQDAKALEAPKETV